MRLANDECTSVWCSEHTGAELDAYFAEQYEDESQPISAFARDLGVHFYDHDWLERIESAEHGHSTVGDLIRRTGSGQEMAEALGPLTVLPARCVVILYRVEVKSFPKSFPKENANGVHPLRHLGNIHTPKALAR